MRFNGRASADYAWGSEFNPSNKKGENKHKTRYVLAYRGVTWLGSWVTGPLVHAIPAPDCSQVSTSSIGQFSMGLETPVHPSPVWFNNLSEMTSSTNKATVTSSLELTIRMLNSPLEGSLLHVWQASGEKQNSLSTHSPDCSIADSPYLSPH